MSPSEFALVSERAIMFASIVFVLALFAHIAEWARSISHPEAKAQKRALVAADGAPCAAVSRSA